MFAPQGLIDPRAALRCGGRYLDLASRDKAIQLHKTAHKRHERLQLEGENTLIDTLAMYTPSTRGWE